MKAAKKISSFILWVIALFRDDAGKIPEPINRADRRSRKSMARRGILPLSDKELEMRRLAYKKARNAKELRGAKRG